MRRRRGRGSSAAGAAVAAALCIGLGVGWASTNSNAMPSTNRLAVTTLAVGIAQVRPAACTGTLTSIADVPSGGATFNVNTTGVLVLGTNGNDDVNAKSSGGYTCFVGGGPVSGNVDNYFGFGSTDECILAASNSGNVKKCIIVQSSP